MVTPLTEAQFARQVEDLARLYGYKIYHSWISVRSAPGFPDLVLASAARRRLIVAELKGTSGRPSAAQLAWLEELRGCGPPEAQLWYPHQIEAVRRCLAGTRDDGSVVREDG